MPTLQGIPANVRKSLILPETRVPTLIFFAADSMGLSSFKFSWNRGGSEKRVLKQTA